MSVSLEYGDYVAIVYASLQTCGLLSTSLYVLFKSSSSDCIERLKEIWSYKWIYFSSLSTIYDQATDIGVLIYWYSLIDNKNIKHVDMMLSFVLSCIFLSISRFVTMYHGYLFIKSTLLGLFLGIFDLLIITFVWGKITENDDMFEEMEQDEDEFTKISELQVFEVFFETLPQILLQSLFLIRTFNNEAVYDASNIYLVWISLFISVVSATNKISHMAMTYGGNVSDRDEFKNKYNIRNKCPIINIGVLSKKIYFILTIITRLFLYSLLWSVCGGVFVCLFVVSCCVVFVICVKRHVYEKEDVAVDDSDSLFWICLAFLQFEAFGFVGNFDHSHESSEPKQFIHHNTLNLFGLLLILYFGIDNSFDCDYNLCADKKIRSFSYNTFVFVLFLVVICAFLLQIILFLSIPKFDHLSQEWEDSYQRRKQIRKSNVKTMNNTKKSPVVTMVDIQVQNGANKS